jgi:hypothetical protein
MEKWFLKDVVIAITAEVKDMQKELNLVWDHLLSAFSDEALPPNSEVYDQLLEKIDQLALIPHSPGENPRLENEISGSTYDFIVGDKKETISFNFEDGACSINEISSEGIIYPFTFGRGQWKLFETNKPGTNLIPHSGANLRFLAPFKVAGAYNWQGENTLQLSLRYIESPHSEYYTFEFTGDNVTLSHTSSRNRDGNTPILYGKKTSNK